MSRSKKLREVRVSLGVWQSLVRFAAISRVDLSGHSREQLAVQMGKRSANLHTALFGRTEAEEIAGTSPAPIARSFLQDLERTLRVVSDRAAPAHRRWPLTTLTGLREELSEEREPEPGARVHGAWFTDLAAAGPARNSVEALVRGEALFDRLRHRQRPADVTEKRILDADELEALRDLLSVAGLPPSTGMAAIRVLGRIGIDALDEIRDEIYRSPVGFRSLRPLTRMLQRTQRHHATGEPWTDSDQALLGAVEALLLRIVQQQPTDPCLGRGFFVEALRAAPADPPRGTWGWVDRQLVDLISDSGRPIRERMFALEVATARLPVEAGDALLDRVAARETDAGFAWAVALIRHRRASPNGARWPNRPEPAVVARVERRLADLEPRTLPLSVAAGTRYLISEALLTTDETIRRRACDVLNVAHLSDVVAPALGEVFAGDAPRWLLEHTAYVLGYLDGHDALDPLRDIITNPLVQDPTVLHAAAWGLGDSCGGTPGDHRHCLPVPALTALLEHERAAPRHAAAYALAIVHPWEAIPVLARAVNEMNTDRTTRALARWGQWLHEADGNLGRRDAAIGIPGSRTLGFGDQSSRHGAVLADHVLS